VARAGLLVAKPSLLEAIREWAARPRSPMRVKAPTWLSTICLTKNRTRRKLSPLIKAAGRIGLAIPGDIRDEAFCQRLVAQGVEGLGGLDIVVNNAGRQQSHASIPDISTDQFDWTMKTNIYAPFWIIKAALPHLKPGSVIIGTASEQAYDPAADLYDYAQTKAATMNYVKSLAKRLVDRPR
jgi:NAD(P)-dependent dehydrogenase (short-subunit alcohol dehydrogenase family)